MELEVVLVGMGFFFKVRPGSMVDLTYVSVTIAKKAMLVSTILVMKVSQRGVNIFNHGRSKYC